MIKFKSLGKKDDKSQVISSLSKASEAHLIDVNGKDTKLILAVKTNILCYSLIDKVFVSSYEGHANPVKQLKFMEYTIEQKKEIDEVNKDYFMSIAESEQFCNMWKSSKKENDKVISHPLKMLELTDNKP